MRVPLFVSVALLALGLAGCAPAAPGPAVPVRLAAVPAPACAVPWDRIAGQVRGRLTVAEIAHPRAFMAAFNALPPASDIDADRVMVLARRGGRMVLVFLRAGCVLGMAPVTPAVLDLMGRAA